MKVKNALKILEEINKNGGGDFELQIYDNFNGQYKPVIIGDIVLKKQLDRIKGILLPVEKLTKDNCFVVLYEE